MRNISKRLGLLFIALTFVFSVGVQTADAGANIKIGKNSSLRINYREQLYTVWRDTGSGPNKSDPTTDIYFKRNRFTFSGKASRTTGFVMQIEHKGPRAIGDLEVFDDKSSALGVLDAFLTFKFSRALRLRVGITKDPLTRENNEGCFDTLNLDRGLFIYTPFQPSRDTGIVAWGRTANKMFQYRVGIMEGREGGNSPKSSLRYTGRVHVTLLDRVESASLIYRGSFLGKKKVLTFGAGAQYEPDVVYANLSAQTGAKDNLNYTFDGFFEYPTPAGVFTLSAAYLAVNFDNAYKGGDPDPAGLDFYKERKGWYVKAGYLIPTPFVEKVQLFGRFENWKFAQLRGINDQELTWSAFGVNYLINGQNLRITVEYAMTDYQQELSGPKPSEDFTTITTMLQFLF